VCADCSDPRTENREIRALNAAIQELGRGTGYLLTMDSNEIKQQESSTIVAMPAWEWMLETAKP
ncbi:MAG: hypothetical protein LBK67_08040, partial [Coriobacteriales bacterium]|nr:hypothetical protein [Coriobacteriales bacterium]